MLSYFLFGFICPQIHICLKCENSLNSVPTFIKIMETFVKTALNTVCQVKQYANSVKSCETWTVLKVTRDYLYHERPVVVTL